MQHRPNSNRSDYDFIRQAVADAMAPFVERLSKVEQKQDESDKRYYTREMTDQKFDDLKTAITDLKDTIKSQRELFWKLIGGASAVIAGVVMLAQHVSVH